MSSAADREWFVERLRDLLDDPSPIVRRHAASAAVDLSSSVLFDKVVERASLAEDDAEAEALAYAVIRLAPAEEVANVAIGLIRDPLHRRNAWRIELMARDKLVPRDQLRLLRAFANVDNDRTSDVNESLASLVADIDPDDTESLVDVGYVMAAWNVDDEQLRLVLRSNPDVLFRGMLAAVAEDAASEWDLARYLPDVPLETLEEIDAPETLVERKRWMLEPSATTESGAAPLPRVERERPLTLKQLLAQSRETGDPVILRRARTLKAQTASLVGSERGSFLTRLEGWWPASGFRETITFESRTSWRITYTSNAWLEYGPVLDAPLSPARWADIATAGVFLGDAAEWLRRRWTTEAASIIATTCADPRIHVWQGVLRATPDRLPDELVSALVHAVEETDAEQHFELWEVGERLYEEGQLAALRDLAAKGRVSESVLRPLLARAGDIEAARLLLEQLRDRLRTRAPQPSDQAVWAHSERDALGWLTDVQETALLPLLFECLRVAEERLRSDPFGPISPLKAAIRAIGGQAAVDGYNELIEDTTLPGAVFLVYDRDQIVDDELRLAGTEAAQPALKRLGLADIAER